MAPTMNRRSIASTLPMLVAAAATIPNQIHSDVARAEVIRQAFAKTPRRRHPFKDLSSKRGKKRRSK
jgi:hypothetical protein